MTMWIAPNCPVEVERVIRAEAAKRGEDVMPRRPFPWNRKATDEKVVAERKAAAPLKPAQPQQPCDHGLFSDDAKQTDLIDRCRRV